MKLFSTEQVSKYHPDKYADQISDAILDLVLMYDENARVAVETLVKGTTVVVAGEITAYPQVTKEMIERHARLVAKKLNYEIDRFIYLIEAQSPEIAKAVNAKDGITAGDQGMMFGYATNESDSLLPWGFDLANRIIKIIEADVEENPYTILKGDAKVQVTVDLDAPSPEESLHTLLISVCHHSEVTLKGVQTYVKEGLLARSGIKLDSKVRLLINPAGTWTIGGPIADCGVTGRKIVCDQYGGYCPVGGGAFSGKDPTKVDRSGGYMARKIAVDLLKKHNLVWCEVQIAYAIGVAQPVSVVVTNDKGLRLEDEVAENYDLTPSGIIKSLGLIDQNYQELASGCHYYPKNHKSKEKKTYARRKKSK